MNSSEQYQCRPGVVFCRRFLTRRLRGLVDVVIAVVILGVVTGLAVKNYHLFRNKAYVTDAISNSTTIKQLLTLSYYETGVWTSKDLMVFDYSDDYRAVKSVEYVKGGFTFVIELTGERYSLTMRAAESQHSVRAPLMWLCGYGQVPEGYMAVAENKTNLPKRYLPIECRGRADAE